MGWSHAIHMLRTRQAEPEVSELGMGMGMGVMLLRAARLVNSKHKMRTRSLDMVRMEAKRRGVAAAAEPHRHPPPALCWALSKI